jgi:hypothetical protein
MNHSQAIALAELQQKTIEQIQVETAYTWAYRAWAAKQLGLERNYDSYRDEAVEHAALSGDDDVLHAVRRIIAG